MLRIEDKWYHGDDMHVLEWVESLPSAQEVLFISGFMICYALIVIGVVYGVRVRWPKAFSGVSASVFSPLGAIFGLTAAFLGADVWDNESAALRAVNEEARALSEIWVLSESMGSPIGDRIRADIKEYGEIVLKNEWPVLEKMSDPYNEASIRARELLYDIMRQVAQFKTTDEIGLAQFEIDDLIRQAFVSRTLRIDIAIHHVSYTKLYQTLSLGLLLILAIAVVHSTEIRLLTVMTFGATLVVSLVVCGVIANDEPYEVGASSIDPTKFYLVHRDFSRALPDAPSPLPDSPAPAK